jgi:Zn finger protein HypA/HybF involved in hydrogenase expression
MTNKFSPIAWKLEDLAKDKYNQFTENTIAQLRVAAEIVRNHDVVHAEWNNGYFRDIVCSACLHPSPIDKRTDYCPNCGAKMEDSNV